MSTFNELILIPKSEYEKLNSKGHNNGENELSDIKKSKNLNKHQKKVMYQEKLKKFLSTAKEMREPVKLSVKKEYQPILNNEKEEDYLIQRLKLVPKEYRSKIFNIYNKLKSIHGVQEGEKSVIISGKKLNYSLFDYIKDSVQPKTAKRPLVGYPHIVKLMYLAKLHRSSIAHSSYQKRLDLFRSKVENLDDTQVGSGTARIDFRKWSNFRF